MRILLDEQLDRRLKRLLDRDFVVKTVEEQGWKGKKNGVLLRLAQAEFDAFLTMDKSIEYQQQLSLIHLRIIILSAYTNRLQDTAPLIPEVMRVLRVLQPGQIARVSS